MGTQTGVGISHHRNPSVAGREAASRAITQADVEQPDVVFVFASVGYDQPSLIAAVREITGEAPLCGCSGEGIIVQGEASESNFSVAVMVIRSDDMRFQTGITSGLSEDSALVGAAIGQEVCPHIQDDTRALFLFPDGMMCNFDRLVGGLEQTLNRETPLPLVGGYAADNAAMKQIYQYCNSHVRSGSVSWALLSGDVRLFSVVNHGCLPIGAERKVTRSKGNIIYEIDHSPALTVFEEYLPMEDIRSWGRTTTSLGLGFRAPSHLEREGYDEYIIRSIPTKDDEAGSVMISTEVSEGTSIWMTRRDYDKMADGVCRMAEQMTEQLGGNTPKMVFHFDCAGRGKMMLREDQKLHLLSTLQQQVGPHVPWIGFYTFGEIGPVGKHNCFHNYTAVITVLY